MSGIQKFGGGSFTKATEYARLAKKTKGKYLPVRNPCQLGTDITPTIDAECSASTVSVGQVVTGPATSSYRDTKGRITCDPLGRNRRKQMRDAVTEVFNLNPYIIVD